MSEVGVRKILRSSSLISAVNVFGAVAAFLANLVVARLVGPTALGAVGLVGLWLLYAGLLRPGLLSAAYRQMLHFGGSGNPERALHAQNVALTYEGALVPVASLALMSAGLLYRRPLLRIGMFLAGATFLVQSFVRYQEQLQWAGHRFGLIARANLINRIFNPILDVAGAWLIGAYGLLIAPILTALATICFYWRAAPASGFRPTRDDAKAKELLAAGLPLTMITVLYWGFRTSDRTMVAAWFPLKALGYFVFAMSFIDMGLQLCSDFYNVLQVKLLSELGRIGGVRSLAPQVERLAILTAAVTCAGANIAQAGFGPVIGRFLPKFLPSVAPFDVLAFNLACLSASILPSTLLTSALLNRQKTCSAIQLSGLLVNICVCVILTSRGWGLVGVALSSVASQISVSILHYRLLHSSLFDRAALREKARFYFWLAALPAACALTYALLLRAPRPEGWWLGAVLLRAGSALAVWAVLLELVRRCWWADSTALSDAWAALRGLLAGDGKRSTA